jgi:thiamine kinase-like enzyme
LGEFHLPTNHDFCGLITCLSHGDFTPWNMIIEKGEYRLIDWEMAEERPLGYDIFTYTLRQKMLTEQLSPTEIVKSHADDYSKYFAEWNITDYTPYLQWYAKELSNKYNKLMELL